MLNVFPTLLSFALLAPVILRITLGIIFIYISYFIIYKNGGDFLAYYKKNKYPVPGAMTWFLSILTSLTALFLILGFLTQVVAIISIYILISLYLSDKDVKAFEFSNSFYILAGVVALSLLFLGAGAFAIDLPL